MKVSWEERVYSNPKENLCEEEIKQSANPLFFPFLFWFIALSMIGPVENKKFIIIMGKWWNNFKEASRGRGPNGTLEKLMWVNNLDALFFPSWIAQMLDLVESL